MDAIGQLAGASRTTQLTVIRCYSDVLIQDFAAGSQQCSDLEQISKPTDPRPVKTALSS